MQIDQRKAPKQLFLRIKRGGCRSRQQQNQKREIEIQICQGQLGNFEVGVDDLVF